MVGRMFENFKSAEQVYFKRAGIFPIMITLGIRNDIAGRYPWLTASLFKAYEKARRLANHDLEEVTALKIGRPRVAQEFAETKALMGENYWSYGVASNRKTLEALCDLCHSTAGQPALAGVQSLARP